MRRNLKILFSIISFVSAIGLTIASSPPYESHFFYTLIILILLGGLIISLFWATWKSNNWKDTFEKSLEVSFGISSLVIILGYFYATLEPIILK